MNKSRCVSAFFWWYFSINCQKMNVFGKVKKVAQNLHITCAELAQRLRKTHATLARSSRKSEKQIFRVLSARARARARARPPRKRGGPPARPIESSPTIARGARIFILSKNFVTPARSNCDRQNVVVRVTRLISRRF